MYSGVSKLAVVVFGLVALCVPRTAIADSITPKEYAKDLAIVTADIAKNPDLFLDSKDARADFKAGEKAGDRAMRDLAKGDVAEAQEEFQIAIIDLNDTLADLGLPPLPGDPYSLPEPSTGVLLGIGVAVAVGMKFRQRKYRRVELSPAS
jgi:hypothetical protein